MLSIRIKDGDRVQFSHGGVTAWVTVVKEGPYIRLLVDGPRQIKVLREILVIQDTVPAASVA